MYLILCYYTSQDLYKTAIVLVFVHNVFAAWQRKFPLCGKRYLFRLKGGPIKWKEDTPCVKIHFVLQAKMYFFFMHIKIMKNRSRQVAMPTKNSELATKISNSFSFSANTLKVIATKKTKLLLHCGSNSMEKIAG